MVLLDLMRKLGGAQHGYTNSVRNRHPTTSMVATPPLLSADATGVLGEHKIGAPVQAILHPPVTTHRLREALGISADGVDKVAGLERWGLAAQALPLDHPDAA